MKNVNYLFILLFLFYSPISAQIIEKENLIYQNVSYDIAIFKIDSNTVKRFKVIENKSLIPSNYFLDSISGNFKYFSSNAGIVDSSCNLIGLYINDSKIINKINLESGEGNFYLKPNGFIAFNDSDVIIRNSSEYNSSLNFRIAIQSGPMLITNDLINKQFNINSKNENRRLGVGTFFENSNKYLIYAISNSPISLYKFSSFLKDVYRCNNALIIDSGQIVDLHLSNSKNKSQNIACSFFYYKLN